MVIVQLISAVFDVDFVYGDTSIFLAKALAPEDDGDIIDSFQVPLLSPAV